MGQKTPASSLRITINRQYDLCWFKETKYYSDLFFKDFQYREYLQSICSQLPSLIYFGRIFSSAYPKKYNVHLFPCFQNTSDMKQVNEHSTPNNSAINKNQIFQDFLGSNLRRAQFSNPDGAIALQRNKQAEAHNASTLGDLEKVSHQFTTCHTDIAMFKTPHFESSAHFFNAILIQSFKKSNSYRRAIKTCLTLAQESPHIAGIRITCAGRFNGAERARLETRSWGQTSLQHLDSRVDYSSKAALTNAGLLGIKVWVSYV